MAQPFRGIRAKLRDVVRKRMRQGLTPAIALCATAVFAVAAATQAEAQATTGAATPQPEASQRTASGTQPAHTVQSEYQQKILDRLRQQFLETGVDVFDATELLEPLYYETLDEWKNKGAQVVQGVDIRIPATNYAAYGGPGRPKIVQNLGGKPGNVVAWEEEESWLAYEVVIPKSGLYNIEIEFYPLPGKRASIQRDLMIDGVYPFNEARRLIFHRTWKDAALPKQDNQGNDVRPKQVESPRWSTKRLQDPQGLYPEPFLFYLTEGRHRLHFTAVREPMAISYIRIVSPDVLPTYAEVEREYQAKGYKPVENFAAKLQMEFPLYKSDPTIRAEFGFDPMEEPPSEGLYRLNRFGDWRWRLAGQWAEWKFSVPEDGLYQIAFKAWQGWETRMPTVREIAIDGKIPFEELNRYQFLYDKYWQMVPLSDPKTKKPFLFYLTKGEHTLSMRIQVGPIARTIRMLEDNIRELGKIARQITMITGPNPDPNMDWEVYKKIPDLLPRLERIAQDFENEAKWVFEFAGSRPRLGDQLLMTTSQLRNMVRKPETIQNRLGEIGTLQSSLGYWVLQLQYHPLALDYMMVTAPGAVLPATRARTAERLSESVKSFLASFQKNYTGVGSIYEAAEQVNVIELWVARGREWALIMKDMIEEDFTPQYGTRVNVNVIPGTDTQLLLLAASSGRAPDVATGVSAGLPVDFAIRGGVLNLNEFPDYPEIAARFRPGALIPYKFQGGDYALPETQGFNMTFYRTDILGAFGLTAPDTWQDVIAMLPTLQQYGMNFYYPAGAGNFTPLLYQHGGDFYTPDGLHSNLDTPEALAAFKLWTELYANFRVPIEANFYNRMRTGEIPIGVADYNNYLLLSTAAPELTGWWQMVPIPGTRRPDGVIDRTTGGHADVGVIFSSSKYPQESWNLLKWWTSDYIQGRFGEELEALIGVEARWNTANVTALFDMPWPKRDIAAIAEQWKWFREQPVVLGGYFTGRHIQNAWNRVVLQGWNPREALELAVKDVDKELQRKQEEFGMFIEPRRRRSLTTESATTTTAPNQAAPQAK